MFSIPRTAGLAALICLAGCATNPAAERARHAMPACPAVKLPATTKFTATPFETGLPASGQWRDGFDLADMDGDGRLDLLHGPPRKGKPEPVIFLGDGKGHFQRWAATHFPPLPYDYGDAKAGDFNGDGRMDIALSAHLRGIATLVAESAGHYTLWGETLTLAEPAQTVADPPFSSRNMAVLDWDGDGKPDLLALNEGPTRFQTGVPAQALGLWLNRPNYWERLHPKNALQSFGDSLAVGDVDGDGHPDALFGTQVAGSRFALQIGDGGGFHSRELRSLPLDATVTAVALHDFDGDGRADIVDAPRAVGTQFCTSLQWVNVADPERERWQALWSEPSRNPVSVIAIGDIDHDGHDDIVAVRERGGALTFAGRRDGFSRDIVVEPPADMADCVAFDAKLADLDGDGALELLVSYAGDDIGTGTNRCDSGGGFLAWKLGVR